ncbi:MAG: GNAT family N-acetyltransferase [Polaribacter sp.]
MQKHILKSNIELENDHVLLIPFNTDRKEELKEIIFEKNIWKYMGMHMNTEEAFNNYIANTIRDKENGICYPFLIIDKKKNKVAGSTRYGYINKASQKCEIGWTWYGIDYQGIGLNKACKYELLKFGFETIGFKRIQFSADQENIRSQKAIEKLGATKEGLFRNNYRDANGQSRNDVYYSIIQEEWELLKNKNFKEYL